MMLLQEVCARIRDWSSGKLTARGQDRDLLGALVLPPAGGELGAGHLGLCPDVMRSPGVSVLGDGHAQSIVPPGHLED